MPTRTRRTAEASKALILDAAAQLLAGGGVAAVQIREVARSVGMTDAGVSHHFGSRDHLLEALLRHGGRRIRGDLSAVVDRWLEGPADVRSLIDALADVYDAGFAELALSLHLAGFRDTGSGLLDDVVDALHARRVGPSPSKTETRHTVAALHLAIAMDSVAGTEFRRSAGLDLDDAADHLGWWARTIEVTLDLDTSSAG